MLLQYPYSTTTFTVKTELNGRRDLGTGSASAAAAGVACGAEVEQFDEWASRQRQRATRDGAWKVEVTERVVDGAIKHHSIRGTAGAHRRIGPQVVSGGGGEWRRLPGDGTARSVPAFTVKRDSLPYEAAHRQ